MISQFTRTCPVCHTILPDPPGEPRCARCGRLAVRDFREWEPAVQWWVLREKFVHSIVTSPQAAFELALRHALLGGNAHANPWGLPITTNTTPADLYPYALELARGWRAAGGIIVPADLGHKRRAA
jgi:hypothetical protein